MSRLVAFTRLKVAPRNPVGPSPATEAIILTFADGVPVRVSSVPAKPRTSSAYALAEIDPAGNILLPKNRYRPVPRGISVGRVTDCTVDQSERIVAPVEVMTVLARSS